MAGSPQQLDANYCGRKSPSPRWEMDHHTGDYVPYSLRTVCGHGFFNGAYDLSSLSEKTRKSNRLQMSLQRQHFRLSYLKTLTVGPAGTWASGLPLSRPALTHLLFSWPGDINMHCSAFIYWLMDWFFFLLFLPSFFCFLFFVTDKDALGNGELWDHQMLLTFWKTDELNWNKEFLKFLRLRKFSWKTWLCHKTPLFKIYFDAFID